jgi:hypothetical protein
VYVIQTGGSGNINFAGGFPNANGLQLNSVAKVSTSNFLQITDGGQSEAGSAFWTTPVNIQAFTTNFTFQLSSAVADGFTFTSRVLARLRLGESVEGWVTGRIQILEPRRASLRVSPSNSTFTTTPARAPIPREYSSTGQFQRLRRWISPLPGLCCRAVTPSLPNLSITAQR